MTYPPDRTFSSPLYLTLRHRQQYQRPDQPLTLLLQCSIERADSLRRCAT